MLKLIRNGSFYIRLLAELRRKFSERFHAFKKQLEQKCRFHIRLARIEVGGCCSSCAARD